MQSCTELSREEFDEFARQAIDPTPLAPVVRRFNNVDLTDSELRGRLAERIRIRKPVYLLLFEYQRMLKQRGL